MMNPKPALAVCSLFAAMTATTIRAATELPGITVTGNFIPKPPGDTVSRDWAERSPEMNWPTSIFNGSAEIFTHNQVEINASCETVWAHLIQAELWSQWCPFSGKVQISGGAQALQKNGKFTWVSSDLPQDIPIGENPPPERVDAVVMEYDPPNRLGWRSFGRAFTHHGAVVASYHNWYLKSIGPNKCVVTFEEVATGVSARYARGAYPELVHHSHDDWLKSLKRLSEARN
jgi:hypothetical protein